MYINARVYSHKSRCNNFIDIRRTGVNLTHEPHHASPSSVAPQPLKKPFWHDNPERAQPRKAPANPLWADGRQGEYDALLDELYKV